MFKYYKRTFAKKVVYNNIEFNSKLEADFAMFLDGKEVKHKGITYSHKPVKWEYEPKEFELLPQEKWVDRTERDATVIRKVRNKTHTLQRVIYTPDFYLPDYDLWVETKGFTFDDKLFHLRFSLFKRKFPQEAIWVVKHHEDFVNIDKVIENTKIAPKQ